jgi:hypothetical protein
MASLRNALNIAVYRFLLTGYHEGQLNNFNADISEPYLFVQFYAGPSKRILPQLLWEQEIQCLKSVLYLLGVLLPLVGSA